MVAQCYELSWPRRAMCFWAGRPSNLFQFHFTSYFLIFRAANATWLYGKFLARHKAAFNLWHGDRVLTNMTSQADSSSSASVPSLKQRSKYLRIKFQLFQGWIFVKILKRIGNINFNMEFTLNLYSKLQLYDYRVATFMRCIATEALNMHSGLLFASKVEKGRIDEVLEMWNRQKEQNFQAINKFQSE